MLEDTEPVVLFIVLYWLFSPYMGLGLIFACRVEILVRTDHGFPE